MGLFDDLIRGAKNSLNNAAQKAEQPQSAPQPSAPAQNKTERFTFAALPATLSDFQAIPECDLASPFKTAALTALALCLYEKDKNFCYEALQLLSGPRQITPMEKQFIADRFMDGKTYIARSYFAGATPGNDYTPSQPLTVAVSDNPYSYGNEGYATLYLTSGGADSPRQVTLRLAKDGRWYLWEQMLLSGVRQPESSNPWA